MNFLKLFILIASLLVLPTTADAAKGFSGKVKVVDYGEHIRVKIVKMGEDFCVKWVKRSPRAGEWQLVKWGEDYKIKFVDYGEDVKVKIIK